MVVDWVAAMDVQTVVRMVVSTVLSLVVDLVDLMAEASVAVTAVT